jgi:predicted extracellular nuclease
MRKFFTLRSLLLIVMFALAGMKSSAQVNHIVISQVYGGGGNTGAQYQNDFVELFNPTTSTVSITGWSVQYASSTGSSWAAAALSGSIPAGKYYLVKLGPNSAVGAALPTPDATGSTGINMSGTTGKVILSSSSAPFATSCPTGGTIVDFVGYGSGANCFEGAFAPAPSNTTADIRKNSGCTETDNNSADFATGAPNPRNSASAANVCVNPASCVNHRSEQYYHQRRFIRR